MKPHVWEIEEIDGGAIGPGDFWICHGCGLSGGPVGWSWSRTPFVAGLGGFGKPFSDDCDIAKVQVAAAKIKHEEENAAHELELAVDALEGAIATIRSAISGLTDVERTTIMDRICENYCRYCWSEKEGPCHCRNDE